MSSFTSIYGMMRRHNLSDVVDETLETMVKLGGQGALAVVQNFIPRFCYFDPQG